MSRGTLYDKVYESHTLKLPTGQTQIFVDRHLVHEVTSPQAFETLREEGLKVRRPNLTFVTLDHIIPTDDLSRPFKDEQAELMAKTLEENIEEFGLEKNYLDPGKGQGICHVTFPENGIIWPGMVAVCGDSHTSTYGAFGAVAFGIGTTEVGHVLATQTLATDKLKVRRINFTGQLGRMVTPKDLALYMIRTLGVKSGIGYVYELGGPVIQDMDMEGKMTVCNMGVEANARACYVNPDRVTFEYLRGKRFAPKNNFDGAVQFWRSITSDPDAEYDDLREIKVSDLEPMISWGVNLDQVIGISEKTPSLESFSGRTRQEAEDAYTYMGLEPGKELYGTLVDVVFIGSCTGGRLSDLKDAAKILKDRKVSVRTLIVPGSELVKYEAEERGYADIFKKAGAEWRYTGCSMCLGMNPDKLVGSQRCVSTSNRNFKGRQGSPTGRTHLASPYTAAATAVEGKIVDSRKYLGSNKYG